MKKIFLSALLSLVGYMAVYAQSRSPRQLFPGLFEQVQLSGVFSDNKTFPDAQPLQSPAIIMAEYRRGHSQPGFNLKTFVYAHFSLPSADSSRFKTDIAIGIRKHIDTLWQVLYRGPVKSQPYSSLLPLPDGFIVPGGRFRETYYWDSYFTMLGLQESHRTALIRGMVGNFAFLIDHYGFIPNGTRTYYLTRSQPPYFAEMVKLLAKDDGNNILIKYRPELLKEYAFWMSGATGLKPGQARRNVVRLPNGAILNRYWDASGEPREEAYSKDVELAQTTYRDKAVLFRNLRAAAESGWDFSSRWLADPQNLASIQTTDIIPVDLNCLLNNLENTIAESYRLSHNTAECNRWLGRAAVRKQALLALCWDNNTGWFMDYNWVKREWSPRMSLAGVYPLVYGLADAGQARAAAAMLRGKFLQPGGLLTTLNVSGQQWDSPNGWAPLEYLTVEGLEKYGNHPLADTIAKRWMRTNLAVFDSDGKLIEKYDVRGSGNKGGGGEYPLQDGFGWTNGVLLFLLDHYKN